MLSALLEACNKSGNRIGHGWPFSSIETIVMFHVPPIDPDLSDIVPARVAASLQAEFEREYREARRDKVRPSRDRSIRSEFESKRKGSPTSAER
jgi:hypothetical protein